jgi:energy-coupling factor transporter ATP-binding protein EcfA2
MKCDINRLTSIRLTNFRCFKRPQEIKFKPITLIYGQNSSGKSSIIKSLQWIQKMASPGWELEFNRLVHQHEPDTAIEISYALEMADETDLYTASARDYSILWQLRKELRRSEVTLNVGPTTALPAMAEGGAMTKVLEQLNSGVIDDGRAKILSLQLSVNGIHLASIRRMIGLLDRSSDSIRNTTFLELTGINSEHPFMADILRHAKNTSIANARESLAMLDSIFQHAAVPSSHSNASLLSKCQNYILQLEAVSLENISPADIEHALLESEYQAPTLPFRHQRSNRDFVQKHDGFDGEISVSFRNLPVVENGQEDISPKKEILRLLKSMFGSVVEMLTAPGEQNLHTDPIAGSVHIPPLRSRPSKPFLLTKEGLAQAGVRDWPCADKRAMDAINQWLRSLDRSDTGYELTYDLVPNKDVSAVRFTGARDMKRNVVLQLNELGAGFSQLIPVLLACYQHDESLITIEQPELHLHPALQAELGDVFISEALGRNPDEMAANQFIIETHSEHILLRILRRIREASIGKETGKPPITPDDVAVLYVENRGDHSVVYEMPVNHQGELVRDWPGGFFEEGLRELLI